MTTGNPWLPKEDETIRRYYPRGGWAACTLRLAGRSQSAIQQRAFDLGIRCRPVGKGSDQRRYEEELQRPGGPGRYEYEWAPLKPVQGLPVRLGSRDFERLPSVSKL